jgi:hypothetical protein
MYVGEENVLNKILKPNRNRGHCTMRNPMIETGQTEETKFSLQEFWQGNLLEKWPFEMARHIYVECR